MSLRMVLLAVVVVALIASAIAPHDRAVWLAEVMPVLIALPMLVASARRFPLTPLVCWLIALFALILIVGGAYTYSRVPLGEWLQALFGFERNPYDRIGHVFQGVVPAMLGRELLLRTSPLRPGKWLFALLVLACLGISACYELVEWAAAVFWGDGSVAFLGTQGDPWDAQWDMFMALIGATLALLALSRWHDRQLRRLAPAAARGRGGAT